MTNFSSFAAGPARPLRTLLAGLWLALLPLLALAGTPVLRLETMVTPGAGVDATAFVDQVEIIDAVTGVVVANAVPNASFETSGTLNNFTYGYNPGGASWTFAGNSGIANNGSAFGPPTTPYGARVAFLQTTTAGSSFSQTLPSLPAGYYQVRAQVARRSGTAQGIRFLVGGVVVGAIYPSSSTAYDTYLTPAFALDAVLQLEGMGSNTQGPTADVTAFVDQVELLNTDTGSNVSLTNPSFENTGSLGGNSYGYAPTGTGWDFTSGAGLATSGSAFGNPPVSPNGGVVALLQSVAAISQVIPVLTISNYRVRLYGAQRNRLTADQVVRVLLNGRELGRFLPPVSFTQYTLPSTSTSFALTVPLPPAPTLTALSPFIGGPGTVLTLTGTNLAGTSSISFFGAAGVKTVTTGFSVNAAGTQITGVVVPDDVLSGPVRATTNGGTSAAGAALFSRAVTLSAGTYHTAAVRADGTLWTWGSNANTTPVQVGTATNWVSVSAGKNHTLAVRADGTLWAWGSNTYGQLGLGDNNSRATPVQVPGATNWASVSGGAYHTVAVRADGTLWAWGYNLDGQLGQGDNTNRNAPVQVPGSTSWASASAGEDHSVAVRADGTLWAWGYNGQGQLGLGDNTSRYAPVQVPGSTSWASASAGVFYTAALRADGTLWTWGNNASGQLGLGDNTSRNAPVQVPGATSWTSVSAGSSHTVALQADGTLWAWGYNGSGQLGLGDNTDRTTPVRVGMATSWLSAEAGTGYAAGEQTCRAVWAWGSNNFGQVGDGTTTNRNSPVLVFNGVSLASFSPASALAGTTVAVTGTGLAGLSALTVNGANALPSVTNNTGTNFSFVVPAAATPTGSTTVTAGCGTASSPGFTVLLPPTLTAVSPLIGGPGTVLTLTGTNLTGTSSISFFGAAGVKTVTTGFTVNAAGTQITGVVVPAGAQSGSVTATTVGGTSAVGAALFSRATTLGAGGLHSAQVRPDGSLWSWGYNDNGQIGLGTVNTFGYLAPVRSGPASNWASVSAGQYFTVAVRTDGTLWSWGRNASGQLGRPSTAADQGQPVQVGAATNWVSVSAGADHVVAVRADGTLWAWGSNTYGQLGLGDLSNRAAPVQVPGASNWVSASAGGFHTVAVQANGTAWAWGRNHYGQLGQNNQVQQTSPVLVFGGTTTWVSVSAGYVHTIATQANGTLWSWGGNYINQLGQGNMTNLAYPLQVGALTSWASIDAGDVHSLAVRADGTLWAWGENSFGRLGVGDEATRNIPTQVPGTGWATAAGGNTHTLAEQSCQAIWGWGQSNIGQVGDGTQNNRLSPVQIVNPVRLLSFTPASAPAGATVAVTGTSLGSLTTLTVNGANALASVTNNTATGFSFVVPAGAAPGAGTVAVAAGCGTASSTGFTVIPPPALTALSPFIGLPGTVLTLTGTNLTGTTTIAFTGAAGTKTVTTGFTVNAAGTSITGVVVPAGAQSGPVTVTTPNGTSAVANGVFFSRAQTLALGDSHTVAVRADGSLWAWGLNSNGQLGQGNAGSGTSLSTPTRVGTGTSWVSAAAGDSHTVAVRADGSLWTWGLNSNGQLGQGNAGSGTNLSTPTRVGTGTSWVSATAGAAFTAAVQADGSLWTWGANSNGQLGQGNAGSGTSLNIPTRVGTGTSWVSVAAGNNHMVAVQADGSLWAWGSNANSQLGNGGATPTVPVQVGTATNWVSAAAGYSHTLAVRADGSLWAWGDNYYGQLGQGNTDNLSSPTRVGTLTTWASAEAGSYHTVAVRADGSLWAWGQNYSGQLGQGSANSQRDSPLRVGTGTSWVSAAAGGYYTAGEQSCRAVWAWGQNNSGQVGDGSSTDRFSPVLVINPVSLLSFAPASAGAGATVAVTGTGLLGLTALNVNGANALASVTNLTDTGFSFVVPASASATGSTTVAAGCGSASSPAFAVIVAPTLTALGTAAELPGLPVTLTGTGFTSGSTVSFGGVAAGSVSYTSPTSLTAVVPVGAAAGNSAVVVTTAGGSSASSPAFEVLQVYRSTAASGCLSTAPLTLTGTGGSGAWRYLRLPGAGGAVVAAIEDTRNLGTVTAGFQALGTATSTAVRQDGRAGRRYLDRNFYLTATNASFPNQTVRVRFFGLSSELARLTAVDGNATAATLNASQYDGANQNCTLTDNDPTGERRLLAAPATVVSGADWFTAQLSVADHFSEFYLTGASTPLPVELTSFTARAEGSAVALAWRTASEKHADRFEVERSRDGRTFARIGTVAAQGSTSAPSAYDFLDHQYPSEANILYYRLRQVDLDGTASYSPVRAVSVGSKGELTLYPNPAHAAVAVAGLRAGAAVTLCDALGRAVARATADASGTVQLALPAGLAAGVYIVRSGAQAQRLTVE